MCYNNVLPSVYIGILNKSTLLYPFINHLTNEYFYRITKVNFTTLTYFQTALLVHAENFMNAEPGFLYFNLVFAII